MITVEYKPYERPWHGLPVDRNLHDSWLERLNRLKCFELASICEGHTDVKPTSVKRRPSVILIVRKDYLRQTTERWYEIKAALADEIAGTWSGNDTRIELEIQHMLVREADQREDEENIVMRCLSCRKRDSAPFSEWVETWFQNTVFRIEEYDRRFRKLMEPGEGKTN